MFASKCFSVRTANCGDSLTLVLFSNSLRAGTRFSPYGVRRSAWSLLSARIMATLVNNAARKDVKNARRSTDSSQKWMSCADSASSIRQLLYAKPAAERVSSRRLSSGMLWWFGQSLHKDRLRVSRPGRVWCSASRCSAERPPRQASAALACSFVRMQPKTGSGTLESCVRQAAKSQFCSNAPTGQTVLQSRQPRHSSALITRPSSSETAPCGRSQHNGDSCFH